MFFCTCEYKFDKKWFSYTEGFKTNKPAGPVPSGLMHLNILPCSVLVRPSEIALPMPFKGLQNPPQFIAG